MNTRIQTLSGFATPESTAAFAAAHHTASDFYNEVLGLTLSSIGVGSFVPEPYMEEHYHYRFTDALATAVKCGCNVIDTAINYRCQQSEKEVGEALRLLATEGVRRDMLFIASKAGFLPLSHPFPENPYMWMEETLFAPGVATKEEVVVDQHCLTPRYLRFSCERSLENMGLETLDVLYLHNPEFQLGYVSREVLMERLGAAFELCEGLVREGKIRAYGIASWNGFLYEPGHTEYLSLQALFDLARQRIGAEHRLLFVQVPYNLAKPHPYNYTNQQLGDGLWYTLFQAARRLGFQIITSSSLLRMNLFKRPFNAHIGALLGAYSMSDVHRALQFARSAPQVDCALFGSKNPEHIAHNMMLAQIPKADAGDYVQIFKG